MADLAGYILISWWNLARIPTGCLLIAAGLVVSAISFWRQAQHILRGQP